MNIMGSVTTKPAIKPELAEINDNGWGSVDDHPQPHQRQAAEPVTAAVAVLPANPGGEMAANGARTCGSEWGSEMWSEVMSPRNRSSVYVEVSDDDVQQRFSTPAVKTDRRQYRSRERKYGGRDTEHISCYTPLDSSSRRRRVVESYDGVVA